MGKNGISMHTKNEPLIVEVPVEKNVIRQWDFPKKEVILIASLADWKAGQIPEEVNPRSHGKQCFRKPVAKEIRETLLEHPETFQNKNRGITILADDFLYDPRTRSARIIITDPETQGIADGATTDAVIAHVKNELGEEAFEHLKCGHVKVTIRLGLTDREEIRDLVAGLNTSQQVKGWSMADFCGTYDWIRDVLENGPFKEIVGYDENAGKKVSILDVLSLLTLFHPEFEELENNLPKAPVVAYANKGHMDDRLSDPNLAPGYRLLEPLLEQILFLHDYVYANFPNLYNEFAGPGARLGRRLGVKSQLGHPFLLPLTATPVEYILPNGMIFPLLAGFRKLVRFPYRSNMLAKWKVDPTAFFQKHGAKIIGNLLDQIDLIGGNPNIGGKKKQVYTSVAREFELRLSQDLSSPANEEELNPETKAISA